VSQVPDFAKSNCKNYNDFPLLQKINRRWPGRLRALRDGFAYCRRFFSDPLCFGTVIQAAQAT
jgi:hypothetical protein